MTPTDGSLLIVGAGPTGLTAAVELARAGVALRVIDRKDGPSPLSKAVGISAHSLDLLEPTGVAERLLADGIRVRHGDVWFDGHQLGTIDFSTLHHRFNFLLSLPQSETEAIMADVLSASGVSIEWHTRLVDLRQGDDRVEVTVEGPRGRMHASCAHVFAADGVDSTVREQLGLGFDGHTHHREWSIADVDIDRWPYEPGAAQLFLHPGGNVGFIIPIGRDRFRIVSNTPDALAQVPGHYDVVRVHRTDTFRIPARQAPTYQQGRVFLGGDAAHAHSPVGARGMNLGIEDAVAFARRFIDGRLDGYTAERHPVARRWIEVSERVVRLVQSTNPAVVAARNLALRVVGHLPVLQQPIVERVTGLRE